MEKAVYRREAIEKKGDAQLKSGKGETTGQLQLRLDESLKFKIWKISYTKILEFLMTNFPKNTTIY